MSLTLSTILAAAEHAAGAASEQPPPRSITSPRLPFFVAGAILVTFAIVISVVGFRSPTSRATRA